MTRRCLITGAMGALGRAVVRVFGEAGYEVRAFVHRRAEAEWLEGLSVFEGDIADRAALEPAMEGVDVVVHLAALLHIVNPSPKLAQEYQRVNVEGTRIVMEAAAGAGVGTVVLFSTIAVYGSANGRVLDESAPIAPETFYARTKADAEALVLASPRGVVIRLAAAYGPRIKTNYRTLVRAIARGRFLPIGRGTNRRSLIFEEDAGRAALLLAEDERAKGRVFNVSDGELHTVDEILRSIYAAVGKRKLPLFAPVSLVRAALFAVEVLFHIARKRPPVGRFTLAKYTEDLAVASERLRELGFVPKWRMDDGWRATAREMRARGEL